MARVIGKKYGDRGQYGNMTVLDPRLEGEFLLSSFPGIPFRIHPNCDGLICHDGEVVVQSKNGPKGEWLDFIREQQARVLQFVVIPVVEKDEPDGIRGEHYGDALVQLEHDIAMPLGATSCPWLKHDECLQQSIRGVLTAAGIPRPSCTTDPGNGRIYTCSDYDCPIHGKRNVEMFSR